MRDTIKFFSPSFFLVFLALHTFHQTAPAQVVISEILSNPMAVGDIDGEWFELHNPTPFEVDINGWTIRDDGSDEHTIVNGGPLIVPPAGFIVLGRKSSPESNGNVQMAYAYGISFALNNSEDEIILENASGVEIDRVEYNGSFPIVSGASMEVVNLAGDNNVASNWAAATTTWASGDKGSPGDWNTVHPAVTLPAFPGAEGFGALTRGGRGGRVIFVTNLSPSGPGSLREALEDPHPRIVIFRTGGTIVLEEDILIQSPYITVAGQTAPGDGIAVRGATIDVKTHDVIIRGLRIRAGDNAVGPPGGNRDCLRISHDTNPPYKVIIDHCSTSWGIDEEISTDHKAVHDVTIQWCIVSEGLDNSIHPEGPHSMGLLIGQNEDTYNVSVHHNLFVHNRDRNPKIANGAEAEVINNLVFNFDSRGLDVGNDPGSNAKVSAIGNVFIPGDDTPPNKKGIYVNTGPGMELYVESNIGPGRETNEGDEWLAVDGNEASRATSPPFPLSGIAVDDVEEVARLVAANAGATRPHRDAVDIRVARDAVLGIGRVIDSQDEVGGWPVLQAGTPQIDIDNDGMPDIWEIGNGYNPVDPADRVADPDGNGYHAIEEYVNGLFIERATIAYAGEDQEFCGTTATLDGNVPLAGDGRWVILSGAGTVTDPADPKTTVTGMTDGVTELEWAIALNGAGTRDTVNITVHSEAPYPADAGPDQTICTSDRAILTAVPPVIGTGLWRIIEGSGTIVNPTSATTDVYGLPAGITTCEWAVSQLGSCVSRDTVQITRGFLPTADFTWQIVSGLTVQFTGISAEGTSFLWTFGDGTTSTERNPVHTYAQNRSYRVRFTATNECGSRSKTRRINLAGLAGRLVLVDDDVSLGEVPVGESEDFVLMLSSVGADTVNIDSVRTTSPAFSIVSSPVQVDPLATGTVVVRFSPTGVDEYETETSIFLEDTIIVHHMSAEGVLSQIQLAGSSTVPFGFVEVGSTATKEVLIHLGNGEIREVTLSGPSLEVFRISGRTDAGEGETALMAEYSPSSIGWDSAWVHLWMEGSVSSVLLTGQGGDPARLTTSGAESAPVAVPEHYALNQNYPNPFNPSSRIDFALPSDGTVTILIYDILGRTVRTLVDEQMPAGYHSVMWSGTDERGAQMGSGVYLYEMKAGPFREIRKMILLQ